MRSKRRGGVVNVAAIGLMLLMMAATKGVEATKLSSVAKGTDQVGAGAGWGFSKNIINIDTFFAAPSKGGGGHGSSSQKTGGIDGGGEETAAALDDQQEETPEQKRQRQAKAKLKTENEEKERLKKLVEKEAAEKAVEQMMIALD